MILRTSLGLPEGVPGIVMAIDTFGEYLAAHSPEAIESTTRSVGAVET